MAVRGLAIIAAIGACGGGDVELEVTSHCTPIDALSLPPVQLGQSATAYVLITNPSSSNTDLLISFDGFGSDEFLVYWDWTRELAAGGSRSVAVQVTPTSAGDKHGVLHIGARQLPIDATATEPVPGLFADVANLDYLAMGSTMFNVENRGAQPVTLAPAQPAAGDTFAVGLAYMCSSMQLEPGATCPARVNYKQLGDGCVETSVHVETDQGTLAIPVTGQDVVTAGADVAPSFGDAHGTVTLDPPGVVCPGQRSSCATQLVTTSVTFTETPADGHHFNGWLPTRCGFDRHCTLTLSDLAFDVLAVKALFAPPEARAIDVVFVGDGQGSVGFEDFRNTTNNGATGCNASCTIYVKDGDPVRLDAIPTSRFGGWAGCEKTAGTACDFRTVDSDRQVTVTFIP